MAKVVSYSDSLVLHPTGYSAANSSYSSISSSYPVTNGYTDASSTNYAYITCTTGSRAESHISYTFDVSDIPNNATITSVTCSVKSRVSSTSYLTASTIQLYSNTTAKGSATSAVSTTATARAITSTGTWTRAELDNIQVRLTGTRGTSNTTRAAYLYFYGATLTINYSVNSTEYELTATSNVSGATISPNSIDVLAGDSTSFTVTLGSNALNSISLKDNNIDVTSSLVYHAAQSNVSISSVPQEDFNIGFSSSSANFYQSSSVTSTSWLEYAIGHSAESPYSTSNTSNTYVKPEGATGWIGYTFDFSSIPAGATINSITVKCYGARENATVDSTHVAHIGLYCNGVLKSTQQNFTSTSNGSITISNPGTWTWAELQDAELRFTVGYYGGRMLGITWTVNYSTPAYYSYTLSNMSADHTIILGPVGSGTQPKIYIKGTSVWSEKTKVYLKVNGVWVEQNPSTWSTLFDTSKNYRLV